MSHGGTELMHKLIDGRRTRALWGASVGLAVAVCLSLAPSTALADPGDIGVPDFSWTGTLHPTGTKRPASELWRTTPDNIWWANMWNATAGDFHIYRYIPATSTA